MVDAAETPASDDLVDARTEVAVLASIFYLKNTDLVRKTIKAEHFGVQANAWLYQEFLELEKAAVPLDVITVTNALKSEGLLDRVGGPAYIGKILDTPFEADNVEAYCKIIYSLWQQRKGRSLLQESLRKLSKTANGQAVELFKEVMENFSDLIKQDVWQEWPTTRDLIQEMKTPLVRIPTGIASIDAALRGGMPAGRLMTLVGAPGSSKTTIAFQIAMNLRKDPTVLVCVCAYDEEPRDILTRMGRHRGLDRDALEKADPESIRQLEEIDAEAEWMLLDGMLDGALNLAIAVEALVARAKKQNKTPALMTDSIQRAYVIGCEDAESEKVRVLLVMAVFKMAKKRGVLLIATSEANRSLYKNKGRNGEANLLAVGKESGAIEYQSDAMLVLQACDPDEEGLEGMIVGVFPKNRIGNDDKRELWFKLDKARSLVDPSDSPTKEDPPNKPKKKIDGDERMQKLTLEIMVYLKRNPGAATGMIAQAMIGKGDRKAIKAALDNALYRGQVEVRKKPGSKGEYYYLTDAPQESDRERPTAPKLSIVPPLPPEEDQDPDSDNDPPPPEDPNPDSDGDLPPDPEDDDPGDGVK